ncbi:MAG: hypothetical protein ACTS4Y_01395 [Candidatus Hodgkinia cicadicola]
MRWGTMAPSEGWVERLAGPLSGWRNMLVGFARFNQWERESENSERFNGRTERIWRV